MASKDFSNSQYISYLISSFIAGTIDYSELQELENWRKEKPEHEALFNEISNKQNQEQAILKMQGYDSKASLEKLVFTIQEKRGQGKTIKLLWKLLIAAAALLLVSLVTYYMNRILSSEPQPNKAAVINLDLAPGTNRAILILSDGRKVSLNDVQNESDIEDAGIKIKRTEEGNIAYHQVDNNNLNNKFNTIETPNGGQYHVVLYDGTEIWLNAASSITYPLNFNRHGQRIVTLKGEAYFQVAKDKHHPFVVQSKGQEVKVLGTHFNVNSYANEGKTVTTLEEGAVMVNSGHQSIKIRPGQQTIQTAIALASQHADMEQALAWKNGVFDFKDADVNTIMRQIARWYDIDVVYPNGIPKDLITGGISRNSNLATVLKMLEMVKIKFKLVDRSGRKTLIVSQ